MLNAYLPIGTGPGGFRTWWRRLHGGSDEELDDTHLMRMAGRFSRRVRAWAKAAGVPVVDCKSGERKHRIAEEYLATHAVGAGVFMVLVARAPAAVWEVERTTRGVIRNLAKKRSFVNHYSFHIMDPTWGHVTIKMSGHPPFGAQVMLNGHEYVACAARKAGIGFTKEGNCFTAVADPQALARVADTLSHPAAVGRLSQVCDRWIYSACLCFGLDLDEQEPQQLPLRLLRLPGRVQPQPGLSGRRPDGAGLRHRGRPEPVPAGRGHPAQAVRHQAAAPHQTNDLSPRVGIVIETPRHDLTNFKVHFGLLTLKAYTKGEHVLRFEAIVHNTRNWNAAGCWKVR